MILKRYKALSLLSCMFCHKYGGVHVLLGRSINFKANDSEACLIASYMLLTVATTFGRKKCFSTY